MAFLRLKASTDSESNAAISGRFSTAEGTNDTIRSAVAVRKNLGLVPTHLTLAQSANARTELGGPMPLIFVTD
jgi:hypothetical protein